MSTSTPTFLPTFGPAPTAAGGPSAAERERLIRRVKLLSWASLAWMTVEGRSPSSPA